MTSPESSPSKSEWIAERLSEPGPSYTSPPPTLSEALFHNEPIEFTPCSDPDYSLISLEGEAFRTRRDILAAASDTFRDMFDSLPSPSSPTSSDEASSTSPPPLDSLPLPESSHSLALLLSVIHTPPIAFPARGKPEFKIGEPVPEPLRAAASTPPPEDLLPFEHIREILSVLAEKYGLSPSITNALRSQLSRHVLRYPLDVYILASSLIIEPLASSTPDPMRDLASDASQYMLSPSIDTLPLSLARKFPTAESYALLSTLQHYRITRLRETLLDKTSNLFPFDYNLCEDHGHATRRLWDARKASLASELDAGTDLATRMGASILPKVRNCAKCARGVNAAVEMIRYTAFKIPRRVGDMPRKILES